MKAQVVKRVSHQEFRHSRSGKSVVRVVYLSDGREISTWLRIGARALNGEDAHSAFDYAFLRKHIRPSESHCSQVVRGVDLFCGCGGLSLGAMEACRAIGKRFLAVAAVDKNPVFLKVYKRNVPRSRTYERVIETVIDGDIGSEPSESEGFFLRQVKDVEILLAGPPCQGHSDLNNYTRRNDERNALYERVARFVEIARPDHVLIENVPTVVHSRTMEVQRAVGLMCELGYDVDDDVVDLAALGVPQKRKRHVVIASASKNVSIQDIVEKYLVEHERTVHWAIGDLEDEPPNGHFTMPSRLSGTNMERARYLHENDVYDLPNWLRPPCHRKGHSYPSMYGRIRPDEPCQTITSGFLSPGQGRFVHPTRLRTLTPHEAARLQFFPDFFDFSSVKTRGSLSNMIGNAVPMKLSYVFCLELLA